MSPTKPSLPIKQSAISSPQSHPLSLLLQSITDGISVQDASGKLLFINDAAAVASGYKNATSMLATSPAQIAKHIAKRFQLFDERGNPFPLSQLPGRKIFSGEKNPEVVIRFVDKKTKKTHWSRIKSSAIRDPQTNALLSVNVITDITKQKETEQLLVEQQQQIISIIDSTAEGIFGIDQFGNCTFINDSALKLFGYTRSQCIGKNMHKLLHYKYPSGKPYPQKKVSNLSFVS